MKRIIALALVAGACLSAQATLYTYTFDDINAVIPDGDGGGLSDTRILGGLTATGGGPGDIANVNVTLNISGGFNGDLYGYLVHDSGFAILLNRVGRTEANEFGLPSSGFNVTLSDSASTDIHLAGINSGVITGSWQADGRNIDPDNALNTSDRSALLSSFNGADANGSWTLFLADVSGGGEGTLTSWGLEINTVPEPTEWALIIFAVAGAAKMGWPRLRRVLAKEAAV